MTSSPNKTTGSTAVNVPAAPIELTDSLRRLDRLASLGLIAASAAHEIKNGLVAISTFAESLLEKHDDKEVTGMVRRELKRIDALVTQMLRYASPLPAKQTAVTIHRVLDHALRLLEHPMSCRNIVLKRDYRAESDIVQGDEAQLQQVFMNLMLNAFEAIEGVGELTVRTELVTEGNGTKRLKILFVDSGVGIATEHLPHVFEPFFTTKQNGTGLGLAICQRVAQEHQGYIEVQSQPGKGSTFIVSLTVA